MIANKEKIKEIAQYLANESRKADPGIIKILWFPHDTEVRLIEIEEAIPLSNIEEIEPVYFEPSSLVPAPSGTAMIRSEEINKLKLPDGWGSWDDAQELKIV